MSWCRGACGACGGWRKATPCGGAKVWQGGAQRRCGERMDGMDGWKHGSSMVGGGMMMTAARRRRSVSGERGGAAAAAAAAAAGRESSQRSTWKSLSRCRATTRDDDDDDAMYMRRALALASRGKGKTEPNPAVGCVIVGKDGGVVGEGYHPRAGQPHAEVYALRGAVQKAKGGTAYVTLEPCDHYGRTPPCSQALIDAGIERVVVGVGDPNPLVDGGGIQRLRNAGVEVVVGCEEDLCYEMNREFMERMAMAEEG